MSFVIKRAEVVCDGCGDRGPAHVVIREEMPVLPGMEGRKWEWYIPLGWGYKDPAAPKPQMLCPDCLKAE